MFSEDASNKNFETVLLLKIVQQSYNKAFGVDTNHQSLGVIVISYAAGAFKVLMKGWFYKL
jgi:hypothetical protein